MSKVESSEVAGLPLYHLFQTDLYYVTESFNGD